MKRYAYLSALILMIVFIGVSLANMHDNDSNSDNVTKLSDAKFEKNYSLVVAGRGKLLYENHCVVCHEKSVHSRNNSKAKSIEEIRQWVIRWSKNLELDWEKHDVDVVTDFLNQRYYHFITEE